MKERKLLAVVIGTAMVLTLGGVAAFASSSTVVAKTSSESTAADTDDVQEGDQTGPDTAESAETEEGSGESAAESDGPGGHEDPAGNVDHQFDGEE